MARSVKMVRTAVNTIRVVAQDGKLAGTCVGVTLYKGRKEVAYRPFPAGTTHSQCLSWGEDKAIAMYLAPSGAAV